MKYIIAFAMGLLIGQASYENEGYLIGGLVGVLFLIIFDLKSKVTSLESKLQKLSGIQPKSIPIADQEQKSETHTAKSDEEPQTELDKALQFDDESDDEKVSALTEDLSVSLTSEIPPNSPVVESENFDQDHIQQDQSAGNPETISLQEFGFDETPQRKAQEKSESVNKKTKVQKPPKPSLFDKVLSKARSMVVDYFTGGNLIVRIGLLILFTGVAFLLKYVAERTTVPIEFRYIGILLGSLTFLILGWKLRHKRPGYALSLLGGGIGITYITLFAAMRLHGLLSPQLVILLLILVVVISAIIAILTNSMALAVIGMIGGYAAPILTSTGSGSHVQLFTYYLFLNIGVFIIAWFKSWRVLNVLGFIATFGIGSLWGYKYYIPEHFNSVQPFLVANFLMYTIIAVLFALKQAPKLKGINDGTLVFGTPLVGFSLQSGLMQGSEYGLAYSALAMGVFYILLSLLLKRVNKDHLKSLIESFVALGIGFATLAIPLGFDGRVTSAMWVAEGAALVWVGVRQLRVLPRFSGYALTVLGSVAFFTESSSQQNLIPWLNADYIGSLIIVLGSLFTALYVRSYQNNVFAIEFRFIPHLMTILSLCWWVGAGLHEITAYYPDIQFSLTQAFLLLTSLALIGLNKKYPFLLLKWMSLIIALGMLLPLVRLAASSQSYLAFLNDGFIALLLLAVFHFVLSWYWRPEKHSDLKLKSHPIQKLFLVTSVAVWLYAFANEFNSFYTFYEFLLIQLLLTLSAIFLLYFGAKKSSVEYKVASVVVVLLMTLPLFVSGQSEAVNSQLIDNHFIGYLIFSVTQLFFAWYWQREKVSNEPSTHLWNSDVSHLMLLLGLGSWFFRGMFEFYQNFEMQWLPLIDLTFVVVSTLIFVLLAHKLKWKSLHNIKYAYLPFLVIFIFWSLNSFGNFHQSYSWAGWLVAVAFNYWLLKVYDNSEALVSNYHFVSLILMVFLFVFEFHRWVEYVSGKTSIWSHASVLFALALVNGVLLRLKDTKTWPIAFYQNAYLKQGMTLIGVLVCFAILIANGSNPGESSALVYLPLFNIIDASTILGLYLNWQLLKTQYHDISDENKKLATVALAILSFLLINATVMRCFHFWYGVPYVFAELWRNDLVQTSLSILWTVTAMILMVTSSRKLWRKEWMVGFGLILAVVIKLFMIDMSASGTIERIVAFLTVGVLLSVIGYFSPLPPEQSDQKSESAKREEML